jgi:CheY-like chemotaxis protein
MQPTGAMRIEPQVHRRLVIADDSAEMRWLVRSAIGDDFHEVVEAADGRELFWTLLRTSFVARDPEHDNLVVITDLCMPGYDGLEVLDAWRDLEHPVPTLLITAFPSDAVRARAKEIGVAVLAKPFSTAALRLALRELSHA